jgi:hypothetical protein
VLDESDEFRKLRRAIEKAQGDRDRAIRNVCRLYGVKAIDGAARCDPDDDVGAARRLRVSTR